MSMEGYHSSVLLKETIDALKVGDDWYLDATLGDGGHSAEIIKRGGKVIGIDVDPWALQRARDRFEQLGIDESKFRLIQGNFRDLKILISQTESETNTAGVKFNLAGAVFDLGVSSLQLMSPERGFSFSKEGPLDMRMDPTLNIKALDLVNNLTGKELNELFYKLGEEKYSRRVVDALVLTRQVRPFTTTKDLAIVVERVLGRKKEKIHPATKIFQALRMVVNDELGALEEGLMQVVDLVKTDGQIVVISFHSLEDRVVKNVFRDWEKKGLGKVLTKKPMVPSEDEVRANPRSRSSKMRVFKKI